METPEKPADSIQGRTIPQVPFGIKEIIDIIPHRYPFLLLDRVTALEPGKRVAGYKNITMNEPFFQGHFPGEPIMPGVLQLEALAQLGAVLMGISPDAEGKLMVFAGIDKVRFRRMVVPGDRLDMEVELIKLRLPIGKSLCKAMVNGEVAVEAELIFSFVDKDQL